jgi:hypothetical protein
MLFQNAVVVQDESKLLGILKAPDFEPNETLVLHQDPVKPRGGRQHPAKPLSYTEERSDYLRVMTADIDSFMLFNDSFNSGVGNTLTKHQPVLRVYYFMAICVAKWRSYFGFGQVVYQAAGSQGPPGAFLLAAAVYGPVIGQGEAGSEARPAIWSRFLALCQPSCVSVKNTRGI